VELIKSGNMPGEADPEDDMEDDGDWDGEDDDEEEDGEDGTRQKQPPKNTVTTRAQRLALRNAVITRPTPKQPSRRGGARKKKPVAGEAGDPEDDPPSPGMTDMAPEDRTYIPPSLEEENLLELLKEVHRRSFDQRIPSYEVVTKEEYETEFEKAWGIPYFPPNKQEVAFYIKISPDTNTLRMFEAEQERVDRLLEEHPDWDALDTLFYEDPPAWVFKYNPIVPVYNIHRSEKVFPDGSLAIRTSKQEYMMLLEEQRRRDEFISDIKWLKDRASDIIHAIHLAEARGDQDIPADKRELINAPTPGRDTRRILLNLHTQGRPLGSKNRVQPSAIEKSRKLEAQRQRANKRKREVYKEKKEAQGLGYSRNVNYPEERKDPKKDPSRPHGWKKGVGRPSRAEEEEDSDETDTDVTMSPIDYGFEQERGYFAGLRAR